MHTKSIETIKIHYDRNFNFYVEKVRVGKKPLPAFISMSSSEKEKLADAYPDKGYIIMSTQPGTATAKKEIEPLIEEYNNGCLSGNITRWYKVSKDYKFILIDTSAVPTYGLQHPEYNGTNDRDEIIAFIKDLEKDLKKEYYGVFICPKCNEVQYQLIVKNRVTCCGEQFDSEICIHRFTSDNSTYNRTLAVAKYLEEKNKRSSQIVNPTEGLCPFTYKGVVYRFSLPECKLLHKVLYNDFACEAVFEIKDDETIVFTDNYLRYLKSLFDNNIRKDLYKAVGRIHNEINSQVNSINSVERAFYWYINNYDLNEENALVWKVDDRKYKFKQSPFPVTKRDIQNNFPGATDIVIQQMAAATKVINMNGYYVHLDNLNITDDEIYAFKYAVDKELCDKQIHHANTVFNEIKSVLSGLFNRIGVNHYLQFYYLLKELFPDDYEYNRPFIGALGVVIMNGEAQVINKILSTDECSIASIRQYARDVGTVIDRYIEFIDRNNDAFIFKNRETIISVSAAGLDDADFSKLDSILEEFMSNAQYKLLSEFYNYRALPELSCLWNTWLLYSVIKKYSNEFKLALTSNFLNEANPILIRQDFDEKLIDFEALEKTEQVDSEQFGDGDDNILDSFDYEDLE